MSSRFTRNFDTFYRAVSENIFKFCEALNFTPTRQQAAVLEAVQKAVQGNGCPRIAVKSGQGVGKTRLSAVIGLWFCFRRHNALTVVTAPSMRQCRTVWIEEARRVLDGADPMLQKFITITASKVQIAGKTKWGVETVTATRVENAQGLHAENMMVIVEEASGLTREMFIQFLGTLSNQNPLLVAIGNPNSRSCFFFDCFNSLRAHWECFTFNAEEVAAEYPWLVDPGRNKLLEEMFGRESDPYRIRVLGEFPLADPNAVISSEDLYPCMEPQMLRRAAVLPRDARHGGGLARQMGIDVARFGGDENVVFRRSGNALVEWTHMAHTDPADAVDLAFRWQRDAGWRDEDCQYVIDASGMGQGVLHKFHRIGKRVLEFHNHGKAIDSQYENRITEAWFHAAKLIKAKQCYLPNDNLLAAQLCNRLYDTTKKGKLVLESKEQYVKRIGSDSPDSTGSPDRADAAVLALYDAVRVAGNMAFGGRGKVAGVPYRISA
jgi:phage terminase large subunit